MICNICNGEGLVGPSICEDCKGTGKIMEPEETVVEEVVVKETFIEDYTSSSNYSSFAKIAF